MVLTLFPLHSQPQHGSHLISAPFSTSARFPPYFRSIPSLSTVLTLFPLHSQPQHGSHLISAPFPASARFPPYFRSIPSLSTVLTLFPFHQPQHGSQLISAFPVQHGSHLISAPFPASAWSLILFPLHSQPQHGSHLISVPFPASARSHLISAPLPASARFLRHFHSISSASSLFKAFPLNSSGIFRNERSL